MRFGKEGSRKLITVLLAIALLLSVMAACDDDGGVTVTVTETATATAATSTTATSTNQPPLSQEPVKIGAVCAWSGVTAMSGMYYGDQVIELLEKQVEEAGGILGGRPVKFVKQDTGSTVSGAASGVIKLVTQDDVSAIAFGGGGPAELEGTSVQAEKSGVLFSAMGVAYDLPEKKYTILAAPTVATLRADSARMVTELEPKPRTAGYLLIDTDRNRENYEGVREPAEAAGIETVSVQMCMFGTKDFSPYLTKIKYEDPDVLFISANSEDYMAIASQMMDLGGWGDIQVTCMAPALAAARKEGAAGWIVVTTWNEESDYPASVKFVEDFKALHGVTPDSNHVYFYLSGLAAIEAIKLADTEDRDAIAEAARSGNLAFDTPMGFVTFNTIGETDLKDTFVQIQGRGVVVPYPLGDD